MLHFTWVIIWLLTLCAGWAHGGVILSLDQSCSAIPSILVLVSNPWPNNSQDSHRHAGPHGQGSIRFLMNTSGGIVQAYAYDSYGTLIASNGVPATAYLYTGEQWDGNLGMYYLRARYYKPDLGRFWTMDSFEGRQGDPLSLHKYLYCADNPVKHIDPSGHDFSLVSLSLGMGMGETMQAFKSGSEALVKYEMQDMKDQLLNDFSFKDLASNQEVGAAGEKVWCSYLNRKGFDLTPKAGQIISRVPLWC